MNYSNELKKVLEAAKKYFNYIQKLSNPLAKEFQLTYYSGETKNGYDP